MLQVVRVADESEGEEGVRAGDNTATTTVDLRLPLTVLSCQPLLLPRRSSASSVASADELLRVVTIPPPPDSDEWQPSAAASSALQSSTAAAIPLLVLIQRTRTGHHYIFSYGSQQCRLNGRRSGQQRSASIAQHISRCLQWQTERRSGQPHADRTEVQGAGGKALEDGDHIELGGTTYVYSTDFQQPAQHRPTTEGSSAGGMRDTLQAAEGSATKRRRTSGRHATTTVAGARRQATPPLTEEIKAETQRRARTSGRFESQQSGDVSDLRRSTRSSQAIAPAARQQPQPQQRGRGSAAAGKRGRVRASDQTATVPLSLSLYKKSKTLTQSAIARLAAYAKQRKRGPNGVFLKVREEEEGREEEVVLESRASDDDDRKADRAPAVRARRGRNSVETAAADSRRDRKRRRGTNGKAAREERGNEEEQEEEKSTGQNTARKRQRQERSTRQKRRRNSQRSSDRTDSPVEEESAEEKEREEVESQQTEDEAAEESDTNSASKRKVVRKSSSGGGGRRSTRGNVRLTRSQGPAVMAVDSGQWPEPETKKRSRKRKQHKRNKPMQLRRMRRTPLSLLASPPDSIVPLLASLTCSVCNQLFVQPVSLPCSHTFCDYCLYSRLQLKQSACPDCGKPVTDEERKRGSYAAPSVSLASVADTVAMQALDVKGKRARARRQRTDSADMKQVRAAWRRKEGMERSRERRRQEGQRVEEELSALLGRRRSGHAATASRRRAEAEEDDKQGEEDSDEEGDDDYTPASDMESDDSAAPQQQQQDTDSADTVSSGDSSGSSSDESGSTSQSAASSDDIASSEEDSVVLDRSVILSHVSVKRSRPQRSQYSWQHVPNRSRPPCRGCSLPLSQGELAIHVKHGSEARWSHIACLRYSTAGRTIPLHRIDGMEQLKAAEQQTARAAWQREANDGRDGVGEEDSMEQDGEHTDDISANSGSDDD